MTPEKTNKTAAGETTARCRCGDPHVTTRWERGVEVYEPHSWFQTEAYCPRSNRPVQR